MHAFNRVNRFGLEYMFTEMPDNLTSVKCKQKPGVVFVFNAKILDIEQGWYDWTMGGKLIQNAFPMLDSDEREFLQTAMTPKDWDAMKSMGDY